jgi:glycosyltransferase involved in cell wall biosynthesis
MGGKVNSGGTSSSGRIVDPALERVRRDLFVVVPAFNESRSIGAVVSALRGHYPNVVVVDDGSEDETAESAEAAGAAVVRHIVNRGQGAALQTGLRFALRRGARILVTFDADGQHLPEDIPALVRPVLEGRAEVVLGSRFSGGAAAMPRTRRWLLRAAVLFTRLASRVNVTDTHNGLRAFSRRAALALNITCDRMAHASEILDEIRRRKLPYAEVPVRIRYTDYSRSKGQSSLSAIPVALDYLVGRVLK